MASYFLYKNIRNGKFSITHDGIVVDRGFTFLLRNVDFNVSEKGRQRVLIDRRKNVHAKLKCKEYFEVFLSKFYDTSKMREVTYDPYKNKTFIYKDTGTVCYHAAEVLCKNGKVYV